MAGPRLSDLGTLPLGCAVVDPTGVVVDTNGRFTRILGDPAAPVLGQPLDALLGSPGAFTVLRGLGPDGQVELPARRPDGQSIWVVAWATRGEGDSLVVLLDESTQQHLDREFGASQTAALALLAELPEKNPGPVGRLTCEGTVLMANAAARRFIGEEDLTGRSWIEICPGLDENLWEQVLLGTNPEGLRHESERDGVCILFTYVLSETGDLVYVYGADITGRRRAELALAEQAAQLAEVARFPEMNPGPVLRMDTEGTVLMANAAARHVFGEDLIGRSWPDLCPGMDTSTWQGVLDSPDVVFPEARVGERDYVFAHRYDPRTRLVFVFGADVTARKLAERALLQSEKMATLGTLAAGVAHELNNPAAAATRAAQQLREAFGRFEDASIGLYADALPPPARELLEELQMRGRELAGRPTGLSTLERSDLEADLEEWLDDHGVDDAWDHAPALVAQGLGSDELERVAAVVEEERLSAAVAWLTSSWRVHVLASEIALGSGRISEIVHALKSYSYLGQAPVQRVDVREGIDDTLVILRNKLKRGVEVELDYGPDVPPIQAYGSELNQVWTNLLDNAADAMRGQGRITIRTRRDGDSSVVVDVVDDGPGIPPEIQQRVFDPFFTTKEPGKGTGLGLATTYSIVTEKHHGSIEVHSRPGRTTFTVRLPIGGETP